MNRKIESLPALNETDSPSRARLVMKLNNVGFAAVVDRSGRVLGAVTRNDLEEQSRANTIREAMRASMVFAADIGEFMHGHELYVPRVIVLNGDRTLAGMIRTNPANEDGGGPTGIIFAPQPRAA